MSPGLITQQLLHFLQWPAELLISVFKAQSTMTDVLRLARTCHFLQDIYRSNQNAIVEEIVPKELICYEDALRLANSQAAHKPELDSSANNVTFSTESALSSSQPLPMLLPRLYANAHEANFVSRLATDFFIVSSRNSYRRHQSDTCPVHQIQLLPHERERLIHSWYLCKLYTLSYFHTALRPACDATLAATKPVEAYVLWAVIYWLSEQIGPEISQQLNIWDDDPPDELVGVQMSFARREWEETREAVTESYERKVPNGGPLQDEINKRLNGPCEICGLQWGESEGCRMREEGKGLWEL